MTAGVLSGRVALVVGASTGIGAATAEMFAKAGAEVHAAARRRPSLGQGIVGHELDVVDRSGVDRFARSVTESRPVHAVIVAAGANLPDRSLDRLTPEGWDRLLAVNLTGAFNVVHAFLGALRRTRGDVVLIGSISGSWPDVSGSAYQAAKAGLLAFARGAAFEEHAGGVRFTTILPAPGRGRHADPRQPARAALGAAARAHAPARGRGRRLPIRGQLAPTRLRPRDHDPADRVAGGRQDQRREPARADGLVVIHSATVEVPAYVSRVSRA